MANNTAEISAALKRTLRSGKEYDKLIPSVRCERTNLGEGDTFYTVDHMKAWIEKFNFQTAKLAPLLAGRTLEETVNKIYRFLYSHIQYTADGPLQQLRSPGCTWKQRRQGVDCKSYSVFASSILSNLGIKHFIRQIRQPYFYPEEFTHVYVVVPLDQNVNNYSADAPTLVLDATKHENVESDFIEKVDLQMTKLAHVGLNAPQDGRTQKIIENFESFNRFLLQKGAPLETVNAIRERISQFTTKGKDPKFEIVHDGLRIEGDIFPIHFTQHVPYLAVKHAFEGGLKGAGSKSFSEIFTSIGEPSLNGLNAGIITVGTQLASGIFEDILGGIVGDIGQDIKNVLKYGLSSWGASATPEEMKKRFGERCYPWVQERLAGITAENLQARLNEIDFRLRLNQYVFVKLRDHHSRAKSTRLANDWAQKECTRLLMEAVDEVSNKLQQQGVSVTQKKITSSSGLLKPKVESFWSEKFHDAAEWIDEGVYTYVVDRTTLKNWNQQQLQLQNPQTSTDETSPGSEDQGQANKKTPQSSGSNTGLIITGIAMASLPFILPMIRKGSVAANMPGAANMPVAKKVPAKKAPVKKTSKTSK